ncbi:zinc finger, CCHC-type containing protein [Tanacetum coccineum]
MGDANPIRTLGDYSKPSHEGYKNTIELPVGNNVVPLRSDTIRERMCLCLFQFSLRDQASNWLERLPAGSITTWEDLTTRFLSQFFPPRRKAKLHNDILMFQQHHGESLSEAWTRFKDLLQKISIDYVACERLRKLKPDEAWATIKELAQYEDEGWNNAAIPDEESLDYKNPDIEQLLGIIERKVDTLMKDAISLIGRSEDLEEYMKVIISDFVQLSSEVTWRLKDKIREEGGRLRKIEKITKYPDKETMSKRSRSTLGQSSSSQGVSIEEKVWMLRGLAQAFFESINKDPFSSRQWVNLFQTNENVYRELVHEFFASFEFDASPCSGRHWDPRVKLAHRCIATTIAGRKESTHRVTEIDLLYLYCIYSDEVVCNIPYWLAKYMVMMREKSLIYGGMFVTRIARSYGLLTNEMMRALSVEPSPHAIEEDEEDDEGDEAVGGDAGHEGLEVPPTYTPHDRAHWMYDHTVCQFQYMSTRDNLDPHLQIDPFPWYEADYPPVGYQGYMPPSYEYRPDPSQDDS